VIPNGWAYSLIVISLALEESENPGVTAIVRELRPSGDLTYRKTKGCGRTAKRRAFGRD
jgi:hypothetical protein